MGLAVPDPTALQVPTLKLFKLIENNSEASSQHALFAPGKKKNLLSYFIFEIMFKEKKGTQVITVQLDNY